MDGGAWKAAVHGVTRSRTWLSDFTLTFHFHPLEKDMATHSSVLAWRIPGMGEPGRLLSMGSHCWEPVWGTPPMAKVMRKEASAGSSLRRPPVPKHLPPKPESVLCSHLYLWLYGGLSPITNSLREGANLQLQLIKVPGRDKSVSTYKLLWSFSSLPDQVRPATCDCLQPPNRERHEML